MSASTAVHAADGGFLFLTFRGEQSPMAEQIYFALSKDGHRWEALNGGEPLLISTVGEQGARDPFLLRSHDGKRFYLIATDLSINRGCTWEQAVREGSKAIVIWTSEDLTHWSGPRLAQVAPDDAGCAWAPEAIYDEDKGDYLVFWASTTGRDNFSKQRIWAARTQDFQTFGKPFIYIEKANTLIDTDIVHEGKKYYRFSKDEKFKAISMEVSDKLMKDWQDVPGFSLAKITGYEGPQCFLLEPGAAGKPRTWCLLLDFYSKGQGYKAWISHDLSRGQFTPIANFEFPFPFRHGSVLPVTAGEYERLKSVCGK